MSSVTLPELSAVDRVAPVTSPPVLATTMSYGSMSQVPASPCGAALVTWTSGAIRTAAPLVSIAPPWPPSGALASRVPPTSTRPSCMSPSSTIWPCRPVASVRASIVPVWLITVLTRSPAARASR